MNIIHIKYAVEVARVGSINKASENLGMAQPNISRAIKDLEADFGITIFDRSAKGMNLTSEGREFIAYSQKILEQMNELERLYKGDHPGREKLSVALPRAGHISEAVSEFTKTAEKKDAFELVFTDSSPERAVKSVLDSECNFGIVRFTESTENLFSEIFDEKHLTSRLLKEFRKVIVISKNSPLSEKDAICKEDLTDLTEITDGEHWEHAHAFEALRDELHDHGERCIHASDSVTQLDLLSKNSNFFMIAPALSENVAERFGLTQKAYTEARIFKDVLIYREDHKLSKLEKEFIELLEGR